jgi:hypothetical protein
VLNRKRELERTSSEWLVAKKAETQGGWRLVVVHGEDSGSEEVRKRGSSGTSVVLREAVRDTGK